MGSSTTRSRAHGKHWQLCVAIISIVAVDLRSRAHAALQVVLLDQFSRNCYRDSPRAFEYDARALAITQAAVSCDFDKALPLWQAVFLLLVRACECSRHRLVHAHPVPPLMGGCHSR